MKCPKCDYLGFETGDRCKNCGYDFSLLAFAPVATPDPELLKPAEVPAPASEPEVWLDRLDRSMDEATRPAAIPPHLMGVAEGPVPALATAPDPGLPLFNPDDPDDIPLIALPRTPRQPLSVRRTSDTRRLRAMPKVARIPVANALSFQHEVDEPGAGQLEHRREPVPPAPEVLLGDPKVGGRRLTAAAIDHSLLLAIDVAVVYLTARMAGLGLAEIQLLPIAPMITFVAVLTVSYFTAFTAIGGQTIGKMAVGIRVVGDPDPIDCARAIRRTLASVVSLLTLGLGFLPAFVGADRRTLHDRLTHTRVIGLPSA